MANDGRFFRLFARVNARFRTPVAAIVLLGFMALVLLIAAGQHAVEKLTTGVVFIDSVFFALTGLALIVLRKRRPGAERSVRVPGKGLLFRNLCNARLNKKASQPRIKKRSSSLSGRFNPAA